MTNENWREYIRGTRERLEATQREFALICGVSKHTIGQWERGKSASSVRTRRLARSRLLKWEHENRPSEKALGSSGSSGSSEEPAVPSAEAAEAAEAEREAGSAASKGIGLELAVGQEAEEAQAEAEAESESESAASAVESAGGISGMGASTEASGYVRQPAARVLGVEERHW